MNLKKIVNIYKSKWETVGLYQEFEINPQVSLCQGHEMTLSFSKNGTRDRWRCRYISCRYKIPLRNGTWLEGSRLNIDNFLLFVCFWASDILTINHCKKELSMGHSVVMDFSRYMREVCTCFVVKMSAEKIGGHGCIVDESLFSKRKANKGRMFPQKWVFVGTCRETKDVFMLRS